MKNPKILDAVIPAATYKLPTYRVTDDGIEDGDGMTIHFCKGNKNDIKYLRQEGVFTETLIQLAKEYLVEVNQGELKTDDTTNAIMKLDEALMWIDKRKNDREIRNVLSTYAK